jgi:hypothetical protein
MANDWLHSRDPTIVDNLSRRGEMDNDYKLPSPQRHDNSIKPVAKEFTQISPKATNLKQPHDTVGIISRSVLHQAMGYGSKVPQNIFKSASNNDIEFLRRSVSNDSIDGARSGSIESTGNAAHGGMNFASASASLEPMSYVSRSSDSSMFNTLHDQVNYPYPRFAFAFPQNIYGNATNGYHHSKHLSAGSMSSETPPINNMMSNYPALSSEANPINNLMSSNLESSSYQRISSQMNRMSSDSFMPFDTKAGSLNEFLAYPPKLSTDFGLSAPTQYSSRPAPSTFANYKASVVQMEEQNYDCSSPIFDGHSLNEGLSSSQSSSIPITIQPPSNSFTTFKYPSKVQVQSLNLGKSLHFFDNTFVTPPIVDSENMILTSPFSNYSLTPNPNQVSWDYGRGQDHYNL